MLHVGTDAQLAALADTSSALPGEPPTMNRTMQRLHACSGKWLPKDSKQQLYAVAIVSCVLLILLQGRQLIESHLQSEPAAAGEPLHRPPPAQPMTPKRRPPI